MIIDEANPHERFINAPIHTGKLDDDDTHTTCYPVLLDRQEGDPEPGEAEDAQQGHRKKQAAAHLDQKDVNDSEASNDFLPFALIRSQRVIQKGPRA